ncbi:phage baseplate plug family protein [Chitinasiproducens palmae]|uniref:Cyanophage baseplate Pam3 plug gp18 domain-containing protein n=1 Tax=Chitinasiproducens palmae TaxID=1770053 RepID=A0A1H2PQH8_9BURK|nr:hypothetical protein [Chitinasiproducens palmae]SDV49075.1 hypothetical protein SAMN05216551_10745 [Chitinasiproducens palmae]
MPNFYEIPLTPTQQRFSIRLGDTVYQLTLSYLAVSGGGWVLDIADEAGTPMASGLPLVTGSNLLEPYAHLGFSGRLWVQTKGDPDAAPTYANLGTETRLYWVTDE